MTPTFDTAFTTALICTTVLAALVFALATNVTRMRVVTAKTGGSQQPTDSASPLLIAQRAHGNAIEYIPTLMVMFLLVGWLTPAAVALPLIIGATVSRALHAYGMVTATDLANRGALREAGALGTYLCGIGLAVATAVALV